MTLVLELEPEQEVALQAESARRGVDPGEIVRELIARDLPQRPLTASEVMTLPPDRRNAYMEAAAEAMAPFYEEDLRKPVAERELTAFTALDGEPFYEYPE